jgi:hypothetical protein
MKEGMKSARGGSMLQKAARWFGMGFIILGIAGWLPGITTSHTDARLLFGIFAANWVLHIVYILSGAAGIYAGRSEESALLYFRVIGIVYAAVAVIGFIQGESVLGILAVNFAANLLHLLIALPGLFLGYLAGTKSPNSVEV